MTTVGVIGAGQLGQMLGFAGRPLNLDFVFLDPASDPPARAAGEVINLPFDSSDGLAMLAERADIVTYEFENVPVTAVEWLAEKVAVYPPAGALRQSQDRLREKQLFESLQIPVPAWRAIDTKEELKNALRSIGPLVLKTRRLGYDGKGQAVIRSDGDADRAWQQLGGHPLIAEQWIAFDRELSIIGARRADGIIALYPLTENQHDHGILNNSRAPAAAGDDVGHSAGKYLRDVLKHLDYVGVIALELFAVGDRLLANEFAPRVHNSGHWTIEGTNASQFENHLRAILGLPLGDTAATGHSGMINLLGSIPDDIGALQAAGFQVHEYGKIPRPGRKLGHITTVADTAAGRDQRLSEAFKILGN